MTMSSLRGEPEQPEVPRLKINDPLPLASSVDSPSSYSNEHLDALLNKKKKVDAFHSRVEQGDYMHPDEWYNGIIHATDYHNMVAGKETPTNPHIHVHRGFQPAHYMDLHTPQDSYGNNYEGSHYNFHPDTHLEWFRNNGRVTTSAGQQHRFDRMRGYPEGEPYDWLYNRQMHDNLMGRHPALTNLDDPSMELYDYVQTSDAPVKHPHQRKERDSLQNVVERLHGRVYDHNHRFDSTPSYDLRQPVETGPHIPYDDTHPNNSYERIKNMRDRFKVMTGEEAMPLPHFLSYELYRTMPDLWDHIFPALAEGYDNHRTYFRDSWNRRYSVGEHSDHRPSEWKWGINSTPAMHDVLEDMKRTPMGVYIRRGLVSHTGKNPAEYGDLNSHFPANWKNPAFHHPNVSAWTGAFPQGTAPSDLPDTPSDRYQAQPSNLSYPFPNTMMMGARNANFSPSYNSQANQDTNHLMVGRGDLYHEYLNYLIDNYGIRNESNPESSKAIQAALLVLTKEGEGGGDGGFNGLSGTVFTSSNAGIFTPTHSERAEKRHWKDKKRQDKRRRKLLGKDKKNGVERLVTFLTEGSPVKKAEPDQDKTGHQASQSAWNNRVHNPKRIDWKKRTEGISKIEDHPTMGMNNVTDGKMMDASKAATFPSPEDPTTGANHVTKAPEWHDKVYMQKAGMGGVTGIGPPTNQNTQAATGPHPQAAWTKEVSDEEKRGQIIEQNEFEDEVKAHDNPEDEKGNIEPPRAGMQLMEKAWGSGPDTFAQDALHRGGHLDDEEYEDTNSKGWIPADENKVKSWAEKFIEVKKQYEAEGVEDPFFATLIGLDNDKSI